ncbi:MAG: ABC transporter substrate binding protein [Xanthobacteraceae bacterium]
MPIVFVAVVDPVGSGLVASLARRGGNATGFVFFQYALAAKRLQLLKEVAPAVMRAAVLRGQSSTPFRNASIDGSEMTLWVKREVAARICDVRKRRCPRVYESTP